MIFLPASGLACLTTRRKKGAGRGAARSVNGVSHQPVNGRIASHPWRFTQLDSPQRRPLAGPFAGAVAGTMTASVTRASRTRSSVVTTPVHRPRRNGSTDSDPRGAAPTATPTDGYRPIPATTTAGRARATEPSPPARLDSIAWTGSAARCSSSGRNRCGSWCAGSDRPSRRRRRRRAVLSRKARAAEIGRASCRERVL